MAMNTIINTAINSAIDNPEKISKALKSTSMRALHKSPDQVRSALIEAKKLMPMIQQTATNAKGGASILKNLNIDKGFLDKVYEVASPYVGKIPGINQGMAKNIIDSLKYNMNTPININAKSKGKTSGFKKYPRV